MSSYGLVFGKSCHVPIELAHQLYWAVNQCSLDYELVGKVRKLQLQKLEEIRMEAYDNLVIYKCKAKAFHDAKLSKKEF